MVVGNTEIVQKSEQASAVHEDGGKDERWLEALSTARHVQGACG